MASKQQNNTVRSAGKWQGMNWIRQQKRLAIYLRDGLCCTYCNAAVEDGTQLTLDHVQPHSKGGSNSHENLVTACFRCNSARRDRSIASFARAVANYTGDQTAREVLLRVARNQRRSLKVHTARAKELITSRGSCKAALES